MSIFKKLKKFLNIGGGSYKIEAPKKLEQGETFDVLIKIKGGKEVIQISKMDLELVYKKEETSGDRVKKQEMTLSEAYKEESFEINPGEEKEFTMQLTVDLEKDLSQKGGVLGGLGKLAKLASQTKETLQICLTVHNDYSGESTAFAYPSLKRK